jgi:hypothetical protein
MIMPERRRRIATAAFAAAISLCIFGKAGADPAPKWNSTSIKALLDSCLARPGTRTPIQSAWGKSKFSYTDFDVSDVDVLNGLTQRGFISLMVLIKNPSSAAWEKVHIGFEYARKNGVSEISMHGSDDNGGIELSPGHFLLLVDDSAFPCASRN